MAQVEVVRTFNTPLEAGLRSLFILAAAGQRSFDNQRLVYFDYILVHSADLGGEESLHPRTPAQKGELLVRRQLVQEGLELMRSRDLVIRKFAATGIVYRATAAGRHVASQFESAYASLLWDRAEWVIASFASRSEKQLTKLLRAQLGDWEEELIADVQPQGVSGTLG
jgi:hypothetical protein